MSAPSPTRDGRSGARGSGRGSAAHGGGPRTSGRGKSGENRARRSSGAALPALAAALLLALAACGAPSSRPAAGPVADAVRASLDSGTASFSHGRWDRLLSEGTRGGLVDYRYFQDHRSVLDAYLERVADADLASLSPAHLEALLVNAYNAYTVKAILEHPGVASIRDIDGVWSETTREVGGYDVTLDGIEHNLLRPFFRDPRIHFAVNCASMSCAPLPRWAFGGDSLDAQLERRTRAFLRDTANVRVEDGTLLLSRYFDWYGADFTSEGWSPRAATIPRFVARYARPGVRALVEEAGGDPPVRFVEYDWSLNAVPGGEPRAGAAASDSAPSDSAPSDTIAGSGRAAGAAAGGGGRGSASGGGASAGPPSGSGWVAALRGWVDGFGAAAPVVYGLAYVAATVLLVPGAALTIGAGVAFGLLWGTVLVSVASTAGAAAAFLVARRLGRRRVDAWLSGETAGGEGEAGPGPVLGRVAEWVAGSEKFEAVDRAVGAEGWKVVALTRLSPAFPFNLLNYAFGLTRVRFGPYVLASWIAMLPGTLMYVYLGAAGVTVAAAATGAADWGRTLLQVAGLLATVAVVVLVTRRARRMLREAAGEEAEALEAAAD